MKGSTVDREVLKDNPNADIVTTTLKDLDFLNLEKKIHVSAEDKKKILAALIEDANFFIKQEIIDYSLLVMKINKKKFLETLQSNRDVLFPSDEELRRKLSYAQKFSRGIYSVPSVEEPGIFYHIGIIDYLQTYDFKKWFERHAKMILKMTRKLDVSSQDPQSYGKRFIVFLKKIFE